MTSPTELLKSSPSHNEGSSKILLLSDLVEQLTGPDYRYSKLEAIEFIRQLVEKGDLVLIEDSALISFLRHRHISEYEERRQRLANAWLRADEITILNVLEVVRKEIEATFLQLAARLFLLFAAKYPFSANNGSSVPVKTLNFFNRRDLI
jgi:hypothetical protein